MSLHLLPSNFYFYSVLMKSILIVWYYRVQVSYVISR